VQLRFACDHTGEEYVKQEAWRDASLPRCPLHPKGGCGFARHGTYKRVSPPGTRVPRWYCPLGRRTFSLLPDCLAARLSGTLAELEAVVRAAEQAAGLEAACQELRLDIELPGALRWVRRRVQAVHASLHLLKGLLPELFATCPATLTALCEHLGVDQVLLALRHIGAAFLQRLPAPLGFVPRRTRGGGRGRARQHFVGADPPGTVT
jgi:hypothetical protein